MLGHLGGILAERIWALPPLLENKMLIPLNKEGQSKSKKDMTKDELKDFEAAEANCKAVPRQEAVISKHVGLRQPPDMAQIMLQSKEKKVAQASKKTR